MKKVILFLLICTVLMATGCPTTMPNKKVISIIVNRYRTDFEDDQLRYNCYVRGYEDTQPLSHSRPCKEVDSSGQAIPPDKARYADDARRIRDDVTDRFVRVIDSNYEQFANDLQNHRATTNFLGDITELGVGAAIGITNGERVLQILGVALTAFRGGRKSIDQNFYERQSTPILISKMDASRNGVMSAILQKRQKFGVDKYSLENALGDVIKLFWAGTLTRAFVELSKDTSIQAQIAEDKVLRIQGVELDPIPSLKRQRFSDDIAAQRISLGKQFTQAEAADRANGTSTEVPKITAKYEMIWTDVEATDDFKAIVTELKGLAPYSVTIPKINTATPPSKNELFQLIGKLTRRITEEDDKAGNTRLQELFLAIIKKANQ